MYDFILDTSAGQISFAIKDAKDIAAKLVAAIKAVEPLWVIPRVEVPVVPPADPRQVTLPF